MIRRFLFASIAACLAISSYVAAAISELAGAAVDWIADVWRTPVAFIDAAFSLAIDNLSRVARAIDLPDKAAAFKAWIARAVLHDDFRGGHFDPGRLTA